MLQNCRRSTRCSRADVGKSNFGHHVSKLNTMASPVRYETLSGLDIFRASLQYS